MTPPCFCAPQAPPQSAAMAPSPANAAKRVDPTDGSRPAATGGGRLFDQGKHAWVMVARAQVAFWVGLRVRDDHEADVDAA